MDSDFTAGFGPLESVDCAELTGWKTLRRLPLPRGKAVKPRVVLPPSGPHGLSEEQCNDVIGLFRTLKAANKPQTITLHGWTGWYRMRPGGKTKTSAPGDAYVKEPSGHCYRSAQELIRRFDGAQPSPRANRGAQPSTWLECERCGQWRRLAKLNDKDLPEAWTCDQNPDKAYARCDVSQELPSADIDRMLGLQPDAAEKGDDEAASSSAAQPDAAVNAATDAAPHASSPAGPHSIPRPRGPAPSSKLFAHTRLVWNHSTGEWDEPAMADGGNSAGGNSAGGSSAGGNSAGGSSAGGSSAGGNSAGALDETAVAAAASAPAEQVEQAEAAEQAGAAGTEPEAEAIDKAMDAAMDAAMDVDVEGVMAEEAMAEVAVLEEEAVVEDAVAAEQANRVQAQSAGSE